MTVFTDAFERLVLLLREGPGDLRAHGAAAALAAEMVADLGERVESGVEGSAIPAGDTLQGRMLARAVDWIEVDAGASLEDLADVARALASDEEPIPHTRSVRASLIPLPIFEPAPVLRSLTPAHGMMGIGRESDDLDAELERLTRRIADAVQRRSWGEAVEHGQALIAYADASPVERRTRMLAGRRVLPRPALEAILEHALRHPEDQARAAELLARIGPEGHEVMVDGVAASESLAARKFLHDALARTPDAYPLLAPLLARSTAHQVRHGAMLLGRLGDPRAIPALADALRHADPGVRREAARALARHDDPVARAALTEGLAHPSPVTRSDVASAIGIGGRVALAPALMAAFRNEREGGTRRAMASAAARLSTPAALEELVQVGLARRGLLRRDGYPLEVRLDAAAGLAAANTPASRRCLDRLARDADRPVREAADRALSVRRTSGRGG